MVTVTITGFKNMEEAKQWVEAYSGGVEQDMATWAEVTKKKHESGYGFPWAAEWQNVTTGSENITLPLTHPDKYIGK